MPVYRTAITRSTKKTNDGIMRSDIGGVAPVSLPICAPSGKTRLVHGHFKPVFSSFFFLKNRP